MRPNLFFEFLIKYPMIKILIFIFYLNRMKGIQCLYRPVEIADVYLFHPLDLRGLFIHENLISSCLKDKVSTILGAIQTIGSNKGNSSDNASVIDMWNPMRYCWIELRMTN